MDILLFFFAIPLATIILSGILETFIHCPFKVAGIFFAIFIVIAFALGGSAILIVASIIYTLIAFITATIVRLIINRMCNRCDCSEERCKFCRDECSSCSSNSSLGTNNTVLRTLNDLNAINAINNLNNSLNNFNNRNNLNRSNFDNDIVTSNVLERNTFNSNNICKRNR